MTQYIYDTNTVFLIVVVSVILGFVMGMMTLELILKIARKE
jgi:hypothetical protein